jgi:uncharacterized membrane protein
MNTDTAVPGAEPAADSLPLVLPGEHCPAGAGIDWIGQGWRLFAKAWLLWILAMVILFVINIAMSLVPILGHLATHVLYPVFVAGLVIACRSLEKGGDFELEHVFAGFRTRFADLLILGLLYLGGMIAILLAFAAIAGFSILTAMLTGSGDEVLTAIAASAVSLVIGGLIVVALLLLLISAMWFAPALVVLNGVKPVEAMKASFFAFFSSFLAMLLYSLVMFVLMILAAIPIGLGLLAWFPLLVTSSYAAYRQIFTGEVVFSGAP